MLIIGNLQRHKKHKKLTRLFNECLSCDVTTWLLKPRRDSESTIQQIINNFVVSEHLHALEPPTLCPISDDIPSWRIAWEFVKNKADKIYFTQAVENRIKQAYKKIHNSVKKPTTQQDDIVVIYMMVLLFNIGIRVWHNASVNDTDLVVKPVEYAQRCQQQNFGSKHVLQFSPIVNLIFIPAGTYWQGSIRGVSTWSILLEYNNLYTKLNAPYPYSINCLDPEYIDHVSFINNKITPQFS